MQRLSGKNFDVYLGDMLVHVESASLDIEDSSEVAKTNGIPNGWTDGEVGASGEIEVDAANLKLVTEAAKTPVRSVACLSSTSCFTAARETGKNRRSRRSAAS